MANIAMCRLCLTADVRMHALIDTPLQQIFEKLTNITLTPEDGKPLLACFICHYQLKKCHKLMSKATRTNDLLTQILLSGVVITQTIITRSDQASFDGELCVSPTEYITAIEAEDTSTASDITRSDINNEVPPKVEIEIDTADTVQQIKENVSDCQLSNNNTDLEANNQSESDSDDDVPLKSISTRNRLEGVARRLAGLRKKQRPERKKDIGFIADFAREIILTKEEQLQDLLERSKSLNFLNSPLKCELCYKGFVDARAYDNHTEKHDERSGGHECDVCRMRYRSARQLRTHAASAHARRYACHRCAHRSHTASAPSSRAREMARRPHIRVQAVRPEVPQADVVPDAHAQAPPDAARVRRVRRQLRRPPRVAHAQEQGAPARAPAVGCGVGAGGGALLRRVRHPVRERGRVAAPHPHLRQPHARQREQRAVPYLWGAVPERRAARAPARARARAAGGARAARLPAPPRRRQARRAPRLRTVRRAVREPLQAGGAREQGAPRAQVQQEHRVRGLRQEVHVERVAAVPPAHAHRRAAVRVRRVRQALRGQQPAAHTHQDAHRRAAVLLRGVRQTIQPEASAQPALQGPHGGEALHVPVLLEDLQPVQLAETAREVRAFENASQQTEQGAKCRHRHRGHREGCAGECHPTDFIRVGTISLLACPHCWGSGLPSQRGRSGYSPPR